MKELLNQEQIQNKIKELEEELESLNFGDYSYDVVSSELELLYQRIN